jgi:hypothetical protein
VRGGDRRHHAARIADEKRLLSPVSGSTRLSFTLVAHSNRAGARHHLALVVVAITHHQPPRQPGGLGGTVDYLEHGTYLPAGAPTPDMIETMGLMIIREGTPSRLSTGFDHCSAMLIAAS